MAVGVSGGTIHDEHLVDISGRVQATVQANTANMPHAHSMSSAHCERVLIVNHDAQFLKVIAFSLALHGIDVATATTAESAFSIIAAGFAPSAIIVDLRLSGTKQGEDLICELRAFPQTMRVPLLAVSDSPQHLQKIGTMGVIDRALSKPFTLGDLDLVLHDLCGGPPHPFPRLI